MIVDREADRRHGPGIDEPDTISFAALYSILEYVLSIEGIG